MALSVFVEEMNDKKAKVTYLGEVLGTTVYANLQYGGKPKVQMSSKRMTRIKKGVRLSSKYMAACR